MFEELPGGEILEAGLRDLEAGVRSVDALLVLTAAHRLGRCGVRISSGVGCPHPEHEVYRLLLEQHGNDAYRHYRALMRRLTSLESAMEVGSKQASSRQLSS